MDVRRGTSRRRKLSREAISTGCSGALSLHSSNRTPDLPLPHHLSKALPIQSNHFHNFKMHALTLLLIPLTAGFAAAICPGFNYGIGNAMAQGSVTHCTSPQTFPHAPQLILSGNVYDDSCNVVDGLTTNGNPCTSGTFGCTGPPVTFNSYKNSFNGLIYSCRSDPNSGSCGGDSVAVCVSPSGRKLSDPY